MIEILLLGGCFFFVVVLAIAFFIYKKKSGSAKSNDTGKAPSSLKGEIADVKATVLGETSDSVISSGYFAAAYPGTRVVVAGEGTQVSSALPGTQPGFLLLVDQNKVVTGVDATDLTWEDPSASTVGPVVAKKKSAAKKKPNKTFP